MVFAPEGPHDDAITTLQLIQTQRNRVSYANGIQFTKNYVLTIPKGSSKSEMVVASFTEGEAGRYAPFDRWSASVLTGRGNVEGIEVRVDSVDDAAIFVPVLSVYRPEYSQKIRYLSLIAISDSNVPNDANLQVEVSVYRLPITSDRLLQKEV